MNRLLRAFSFILAICAVVALAGCYEGFHRPKGKGGGGPGKTGGGGGGGEKPYGVVIVDVVRPSFEAMTSPVCGNVHSSLIDVRSAEMDARVRSITTQLEAQADRIRVITDEVSLEDCRNFSFATIESRAVTPMPWPEGNSLDSLKAKPALHVRLVIWYGAGGNSSPSPMVFGSEWADMTDLANMGFTRRISVNYFAITGPQFGYLWNWRTRTDQNLAFTASVILEPVPSSQGIQELMNAVKKSGVDFFEWLGPRVSGI